MSMRSAWHAGGIYWNVTMVVVAAMMLFSHWLGSYCHRPQTS
jgi:hypothetical protein